MFSIRSLALLVICQCCTADNLDAVQVTVAQSRENQSRQNQSKAPMSCKDSTYGFIPNGDDVTGWLKSCPNDYPYLNGDGTCQGEMCLVDPDRYTCCRKKTCSCPHGVATVADSSDDKTLCAVDQQTDCSSCSAGYHMSADAGVGSQTCEANQCSCSNGKKTTATGSAPAKLCETDAAHDCYECNPGYTMSADAGTGTQTCTANTCSCPNGKATVATGGGSTLCETNNEVDCSECNQGYTISATADSGSQTCTPNTCHTKTKLNDIPNQDALNRAACDAAIKTGLKCLLSCADGYTGTATEWTCGTDGALTGSPPNCNASKCAEQVKNAKDLFTANTKSNCEHVTTDSNCSASCEDGYTGDAQTYKCTAEGFVATDGAAATAMKCDPKPCTVSPPANGGLNTCSTSLESGKSCEITCNTGYTVTGTTQCLAGTLTAATCEPSPCDTSEAPAYGEVGTCTAYTQSGGTCKPKCSNGYTAKPETSSCNKGVLTPTKCEPNFLCQLVYQKTCDNNHGYWTTKSSYLDYPGCEHFCNMKAYETGKKVTACELNGVTSEERTSKGGWCFAHVNECDIGTKIKNAAAKCNQQFGGAVSNQSALTASASEESGGADTEKASLESMSNDNITTSHKFKRRVH